MKLNVIHRTQSYLNYAEKNPEEKEKEKVKLSGINFLNPYRLRILQNVSPHKVTTGKVWTAIERLLTLWKSHLYDKIKWEFFKIEAVSLLYGCTTRTLVEKAR